MYAILIVMEEQLVDKLFESFNQLDENELTLVINQVARRMMMLRYDTPDSSFWFGVLMRVSKWLAADPRINETEKDMLLSPPATLSGHSPTHGRVRAIKNMRDRSGRNMTACMAVIDGWIKDNFDSVDESVKTSYLAKYGEQTNVS